jgi:hypothetical protein
MCESVRAGRIRRRRWVHDVILGCKWHLRSRVLQGYLLRCLSSVLRAMAKALKKTQQQNDYEHSSQSQQKIPEPSTNDLPPLLKESGRGVHRRFRRRTNRSGRTLGFVLWTRTGHDNVSLAQIIARKDILARQSGFAPYQHPLGRARSLGGFCVA